MAINYIISLSVRNGIASLTKEDLLLHSVMSFNNKGYKNRIA